MTNNEIANVISELVDQCRVDITQDCMGTFVLDFEAGMLRVEITARLDYDEFGDVCIQQCEVDAASIEGVELELTPFLSASIVEDVVRHPDVRRAFIDDEKSGSILTPHRLHADGNY